MNTRERRQLIRERLQLQKKLMITELAQQIDQAMQGFGYRIVPVRPAVTEVLGEKAYARLSDIPFPVDLVDVFRNADEVGPIVDECIALGVKRLWLQDGVVNEEAARKARAAGITVVMDRCVWRDYMDLVI